jgi:hypothetical protein
MSVTSENHLSRQSFNRQLPVQSHRVPDTAAVPAPQAKILPARGSGQDAAPHGGTILTAHRHDDELFAPTTAGACGGTPSEIWRPLHRKRRRSRIRRTARQSASNTAPAHNQHRRDGQRPGPTPKDQDEQLDVPLSHQQIRWQLPTAGRLAAPFDRPRISRAPDSHHVKDAD